ncbi:hypothetical protein [Nostoc sp.]
MTQINDATRTAADVAYKQGKELDLLHKSNNSVLYRDGDKSRL